MNVEVWNQISPLIFLLVLKTNVHVTLSMSFSVPARSRSKREKLQVRQKYIYADVWQWLAPKNKPQFLYVNCEFPLYRQNASLRVPEPPILNRIFINLERCRYYLQYTACRSQPFFLCISCRCAIPNSRSSLVWTVDSTEVLPNARKHSDPFRSQIRCLCGILRSPYSQIHRLKIHKRSLD